jgi:uncharacterized protein (DUF4415 family)
MEKKERIVRASAEELRQKLTREGSRSDWKRARAMTQAEVERLADEEDGSLPEGWEATVEIGVPEPKTGVHIRLDPVVLRWFRAQGPGYQTRINAVLRAFVAARERTERVNRRPKPTPGDGGATGLKT